MPRMPEPMHTPWAGLGAGTAAAWPGHPVPVPQAPVDVSPHGTVVVMDDDPLLRRVAARTLRPAGFNVLEARDGDELLEVCARAAAGGAPVRVALLDRTIPHGRGALEVLPDLLKLQPTPVALVFSGWVEDLEDTALARVHGTVAKPFDPRALVQTVEEAARAWKQQG